MGQSKMENPEEKQNKNTTHHNMCWTPQYESKHK